MRNWKSRRGSLAAISLLIFLFAGGFILQSFAADEPLMTVSNEMHSGMEGSSTMPTEEGVPSSDTFSGESTSENDRGIVTKLLGNTLDTYEYSGGMLSTTIQTVHVKVTNGREKGREVEARYARTFGFSDTYQSPALKVGDKILLLFGTDENGQETVDVSDVIREQYLVWLVIVFILLLVIIGGLKGLKAVVTLILTVLAILFLLIPAILRGADPISTTIFICTGVTILALLLITGFNKKTLAAVIGTTGGVVTAGIIAKWVGVAARLTGLGDDESQMLMYIPTTVHFDFQGLLFSGIIIGALGASMDVAVSMASAMFELRENNPSLPGRGLLRSGMNIGRDMMATMSNTLILAYTGGALHLLMLLAAFNIPFLEIINRDLIASEVVRALAGSIGLLTTIPITAISVVLLTEHGRDKEPVPEDFKL